jgi:hypothetical protein
MTRLARTVLTALFISNPWVIQAEAEENLVTISSPADGEKLEAGKTYKVDYEVKEATKAHHVHLFVDGEEVANGHKLKGSFPLGPLKAGERQICISPVNKNHTPVGTRACVAVTVQ